LYKNNRLRGQRYGVRIHYETAVAVKGRGKSKNPEKRALKLNDTQKEVEALHIGYREKEPCPPRIPLRMPE